MIAKRAPDTNCRGMLPTRVPTLGESPMPAGVAEMNLPERHASWIVGAWMWPQRLVSCSRVKRPLPSSVAMLIGEWSVSLQGTL